MNTKQEGVITLFNKENELVGMIRKDIDGSRKNVMYKVEEMSLEEMESALKNNEIKVKKDFYQAGGASDAVWSNLKSA